MAGYLMGDTEPAHYMSILKQAQKGYLGDTVSFWRESFTASDNTVRLQVRRDDVGYDMIFSCDATALAAYEQGQAAAKRSRHLDG
jgi:hypothetical protein